MVLQINPMEKERLKKGRVYIENKTIDVTENLRFVNMYFYNCIIIGEVVVPIFLNCVFESCSFNVVVYKGKVVNTIIIGGMNITSLMFHECVMTKCNIPGEYRTNCDKGTSDIQCFKDLPRTIFLR